MIRGWAWACAAGVAVAAVTAAVMPSALVGVFYDDGIYLALARSLAEGHGYRLLYLPGAPAAVHYPPLYPAVLAGLWTLWPAFPANVTLFRGFNAVAMGVFAGGFSAYLAWRSALRPPAAAIVVAVGATAIPLLAVATVLFAEPLFLVLAVAAWWLADAAGEGAAGRRTMVLAASAGVAAGLAALTRSIGIAIVAGVVLALVLRRRRRETVAAALPALLLVAPWFAWTIARRGETDPLLAANYGTYLDLVRQAGWRVVSLHAGADLLRPLGFVAFAMLGGVWRPLVGAPALAVTAVGAVALVRRAPALGWSLACYLGVVLLWPYAPDRFLWAVLPALAVAFLLGAAVVWRRGGTLLGRPRWAVRALALVGFLPAVVGFGIYQVRGFAGGAATTTQRGISAAFEPVLPWVRTETPDSAVLASEDEALLWLYTGRRAVPSFLWRLDGLTVRSPGPDSLRAFFDRSGVTHVILTGMRADAAPGLDALVAAHPGYLRVAMMWPGPKMAFRVERTP